MLISRHLNPPYLGKIYPLSRVLVTIGNYNKQPLFRAFAGNFPETTPKMPPFLRKWKHACDPLMNSSEGGGGGKKDTVWYTLSYSQWVRVTHHSQGTSWDCFLHHFLVCFFFFFFFYNIVITDMTTPERDNLEEKNIRCPFMNLKLWHNL